MYFIIMIQKFVRDAKTRILAGKADVFRLFPWRLFNIRHLKVQICSPYQYERYNCPKASHNLETSQSHGFRNMSLLN